MPVKWTPDNDQILLLKILETHPELTVDAKRIAAVWPADRETPTPRAITERLVRIRQLAKANGAGHFAVASSQTKKADSGTSSAPVTPRKPKIKAENPDEPTPGSGSGTKRKRGGAGDAPTTPHKNAAKAHAAADDDDEEFNFSGRTARVSKQEAAWLNGQAHDDNGTITLDLEAGVDAYPSSARRPRAEPPRDMAFDFDDAASPTKKHQPRRGVAVKVERYADDGADDGESSVSEFEEELDYV